MISARKPGQARSNNRAPQLPQQRVVLDQPVSQLRQLPVRLQGLSQHALRRRRLSTLRIPDHASRNRHAAQQTRSATANHAPRASVSKPAGPWDADDSITGFPSTYEPAAIALLRVLLLDRVGDLLPFHTERWISQHVVEVLAAEGIVGERVAKSDVVCVLTP
jgi:hypothetical protein